MRGRCAGITAWSSIPTRDDSPRDGGVEKKSPAMRGAGRSICSGQFPRRSSRPSDRLLMAAVFVCEALAAANREGGSPE
jgi:hypothetical protein